MVKEVKYVITKNGCWECYSHYINKSGYPTITVNKKRYNIHKYFYITYIGEVPKGYDVMHICDNRKCCNPSHLKIGTHKENMQDMVNKNRNSKCEKHGKSKLNNEQVVEIYNSKLTLKELCKKYNVTKTTIIYIRSKKRWKYITNDLPDNLKKYGEKHHNSKLKNEDVINIYNNKINKNTYLSKKYGVSETTIRNIKNGRNYKSITSRIQKI